MAREFGPRNIHVAHLVIDGRVDTAPARAANTASDGPQAELLAEPDRLMRPDSVAAVYWSLHQQTRDAWTFEADLRPFAEAW